MKKYISSKLRDTELVWKCVPVTTLVNGKQRDCHLTLVRSNKTEYELA